MTIPTETAQLTSETIELAPSYNIPLCLIIASIPCTLFWLWLGFPLALLGLFLLIQTIIIRLRFTDTALEVSRSNQVIRSFPYSEWLNWQIFWQPVPILFYFREVQSIHFLPIIFDPKTLESCLRQYCSPKY